MGKTSIKRDLFVCHSCGTRPCIVTRYALSVVECNYARKEWKPLVTIKQLKDLLSNTERVASQY